MDGHALGANVVRVARRLDEVVQEGQDVARKSATTNERVGRAAVDERADLDCALVDRAKVEANGHANKSVVTALDGVGVLHILHNPPN